MTGQGEATSENSRPTKRHKNIKDAHVKSLNHSGEADCLGHFDAMKPITVIMTPLRRRQGQILARSLREAGARVVELGVDVEGDARSCNYVELLVVTDNLKRARGRITQAGLQSACKVYYVSTKWASAVIASQVMIPTSSFQLVAACDAEKKHSATNARQLSPKRKVPTPFPPVWCHTTAHQRMTAIEKETMLRGLPPFLCERSTITQVIYPSPNYAICEILESLAERRILEQAGGSVASADIRARAYRQASAALKCVPFQIQTQHDVEALRSFGPKVLAVVNEFLSSGQVHEAIQLERDERLRTLRQLRRMYSVGATTARQLYDISGIHSVAQLREHVARSPNSFAAPLVEYLRHHEKLVDITLPSAVAYTNRVEKVVNAPGEECQHLRMSLCGGFRRGEPKGHDVDILYCRQDSHAHEHDSVLQAVVARLRAEGLVAGTLAVHANLHGTHEHNYGVGSNITNFQYAHDVAHLMGRFQGRIFRVDIVGVRDVREFPFATLAWSGSTAFQRDIRQLCEVRHGWVFNQHGLFERSSGQRVQLTPEPACEMDVFQAIGIVYRAPFERSC